MSSTAHSAPASRTLGGKQGRSPVARAELRVKQEECKEKGEQEERNLTDSESVPSNPSSSSSSNLSSNLSSSSPSKVEQSNMNKIPHLSRNSNSKRPPAAQAQLARNSSNNSKMSISHKTSGLTRRRSMSDGFRYLSFDQIPPWARDNPFIRTSYRMDFGWSRSAQSICALHNETFNVWTHLMGFAVVLFLLLVTHATFSRHGVDRLDLTLDLRTTSPLSCFHFPSELLDFDNNKNNSHINDNNVNGEGEGEEGEGEEETRSQLLTKRSSLDAGTLHQLHGYYHCCCPESLSPQHLEAGQEKGQEKEEEVENLKEEKETHDTCLSSSSSSLFSLLGEGEGEGEGGVLRHSCQDSFNCPAANCLKLRRITESVPLLEDDDEDYQEELEADEVFPEGKDDVSFPSSSSSSSSLLLQEELPALANMARSLRRKVSESLQVSNAAYQRSLQLFLDYVTHLEESTSKVLEEGKVNLHLAQGFWEQGRVNFRHMIRKIRKAETTHEAADALVQGFAHFFWHRQRQNNGSEGRGFGLGRGLGNGLGNGLGRGGEDVEPMLLFPEIVVPEHGAGVIPYLSLWPIAVFMLTALACLLFSTLFHLFCAVSETIARRMQALDYAGICLLISGSGIPMVHYGFYCEPVWDALYLSFNIVMGLVGFVFVVLPRFSGHRFRNIRTAIFITMGFAAAAPLPHLALRYGSSIQPFVTDLLIMSGFYLLGAAVYLFRVPERFSPGKFDILCHSHQLWHILVFVAVLWHYNGTLRFYEWRMLKPCHSEIGL